MYIPAHKETIANKWLSKNLEDKQDARYPRLHYPKTANTIFLRSSEGIRLALVLPVENCQDQTS